MRADGSASTRATSREAHSGVPAAASSGRQRLHGRKPATSASRAVAKNATFSGLGLRAGHDGRQKMPVVVTAP